MKILNDYFKSQKSVKEENLSQVHHPWKVNIQVRQDHEPRSFDPIVLAFIFYSESYHFALTVIPCKQLLHLYYIFGNC